MTIAVARREGDESAETGGKRLVVGLTGSIASGKSTIASLLGARGAEVIDADAAMLEKLGVGQRSGTSPFFRFTWSQNQRNVRRSMSE